LLDALDGLVRGQVPRDEVPAVRGWLPNLHASLGQQPPDNLERDGTDFGRARRSQIEMNRLDDLPQPKVIIVTFFDQVFQDVIRGHAPLGSVYELDLVDRDGLARCIDSIHVNGWRPLFEAGR
jgi:hypothetical protein